MDNVSRDDWIIGGLAVLLLIDLLFLPWFDVSVSAFGVTVSATSTATGDPDGWLGILSAIALLALIADLAIERFSPQTTLPAINNSRATTRFALAGAAAAFLVLKFLFHINHFSDLGFGFWAALVLTGGLVYYAMQVNAGTTGGPARPTPSATPPASAPPASTPSAGSSEPPPSSPPPGP